ncbi:hypothetical protein AMTRI_Chr12g275240 [Amborella trichopoda]
MIRARPQLRVGPELRAKYGLCAGRGQGQISLASLSLSLSLLSLSLWKQEKWVSLSSICHFLLHLFHTHLLGPTIPCNGLPNMYDHKREREGERDGR